MGLIDARRVAFRMTVGCLVACSLGAIAWWLFGPRVAAAVGIGMTAGMVVAISIATYERWSMEGPRTHVLTGGLILFVAGVVLAWVVYAYGPTPAALVIGIAAVASLPGSMTGHVVMSDVSRR